MNKTSTVSVEELHELFESEPPCDYRRVNFDTDVVAYTCDRSVDWAHICRHCGVIGLLCEVHHRWFTEHPVIGSPRRCKCCNTQSLDYRDLTLTMRRV